MSLGQSGMSVGHLAPEVTAMTGSAFAQSRMDAKEDHQMDIDCLSAVCVITNNLNDTNPYFLDFESNLLGNRREKYPTCFNNHSL